MWANYKYLNTSFVQQHFRADFVVIAVILATLKAHKKNSKLVQISVFANYLKN